MKRIYLILIVLVGISISCTKNFEDWQKDEKHPSDVTGEMLFSNAQKALADQVASTNVNVNNYKLYAQYWTETTYTDESNYDLVKRGIPDNVFRVLYRDVLRDFREAKVIIDDTPIPPGSEESVAAWTINKHNKPLIIDILEIYTFQRLVDIFGNIPYNEALDIDATLNPVYDDGFAIYKDLINRLDDIISSLNTNGGSFGNVDAIYNGDVQAWKTFAYSLKFRMAITLADKDDNYAKTIGEQASPYVFSSNSDNAVLAYESAPLDNTNPLYQSLVASGRKDFVVANTVVDMMNDLADPRMDVYFDNRIAFEYDKDDFNTKIDTELSGGAKMVIYYADSTIVVDLPYMVYAADSLNTFNFYKGGIYGASNAFGNYSHAGAVMHSPTFPIALLTYSEMEFYKAEAASRGWASKSDKVEHYNNAIIASFDEWGVAGADDYIATDDVVWDGSGDWREVIGTQAYLGFYQRGFEGWTSYRRLDFPVMNVSEDAATENGIVLLRFTYPVNEQTLNATNYYQAADAVGGDFMETKLFWDRP